MSVLLTPAYGRVYKTLDEIKEDFYGGKDFKIHKGPYCSERDLLSLIKKFKIVNIQYGSKRQYVYNATKEECAKHKCVEKSSGIKISDNTKNELLKLKTTELKSINKVIIMLLKSYKSQEK